MNCEIDSALSWYHQWCEPIVLALIRKDEEAIKREIDAAQAAVDSNNLIPADHDKLRCQLAYLKFQVYFTQHNHKLIRESLTHCEEVLWASEVDPGAESLRDRLYLQFRIMLDGRNDRVLLPDEMRETHNNLSEEEKNLELYSYVANWAFRHENTEFLELACGFAVFQGKAFCAQWIWQRARVMLDLLMNRATKRDISLLISSAKLPMHLSVIRNLIWPIVVQRGLDDPELLLQLERIEGKTTQELPQLLEREMLSHSGVPDSSRSSIGNL